MKNRNLNHRDDWMTPPYFYKELNKKYNFDFDPCPFMHNTDNWDGLKIEWGDHNFINPPYSRQLKEAFVKKAVKESYKGKLCVMLLPVSTSTNLFHDIIQPNADNIEFVRKRIPFLGVNTKNQLVNWHLTDKTPPFDGEHVKNSGMHDSKLVIFNKTTFKK